MNREHFTKVVEEALDSLPQEFRNRIQNVAVLVEDVPPNQPSPKSGQQRRLLLGVFHGVPTTKKSMFDLSTGPDHIVLYQENIEGSVPLRPKSANKSALLSSMNWVTISGSMRNN